MNAVTTSLLPSHATPLPPHPSFGPRLVFFTGGTALREVSHELTRHTHNCVHLVTTFDSGGSSAALRRAFAMPAPGDLRNRLLALADLDLVPESALTFCAHRLPAEGDCRFLRQELRALGKTEHAVWTAMPPVFAEPLRLHMNFFLERMTEDFDPRLACLGNLLLAGGYLRHNRNFGPTLAFFSRLFQTRGVVLPIVNETLYLAAELEDGSYLNGQHTFKKLPQQIRRIFLTVHEPDRSTSSSTAFNTPCRPHIAPEAAAYLRSAGAICYPMGSFFSSVLANLLPNGVGRAIAATNCPKIFIPNSGYDPELRGLSVAAQAALLLQTLRADAPDAPTSELLHTVLVDGRNGQYEGGLTPDVRAVVNNLGLTLIEENIMREDDPAKHNATLTAAALLRHTATDAQLA